jgi:hypothetical protein
MQDLIYVALIFALTIVAALFVLACDKLVGPDAVALAERSREADTQPVRGTAHSQEAKVA